VLHEVRQNADSLILTPTKWHSPRHLTRGRIETTP
jgi:hypothetical protein